jgi:hypothetical protein
MGMRNDFRPIPGRGLQGSIPWDEVALFRCSYSTVRDTGVVCWILPAVAVMVTVDVIGVEPEPPPLAPPPQPEASPSPMKTTASNSACFSLRRLVAKRQSVRARVIPLKEERELGRQRADCELVEIVNTGVAATPESAMFAGLKAQLAPAGSPEQAKVTVELKPYSGGTSIEPGY